MKRMRLAITAVPIAVVAAIRVAEATHNQLWFNNQWFNNRYRAVAVARPTARAMDRKVAMDRVTRQATAAITAAITATPDTNRVQAPTATVTKATVSVLVFAASVPEFKV